MNAEVHDFELTVRVGSAATDADRARALAALRSDGRPDIAAALTPPAAPILLPH